MVSAEHQVTPEAPHPTPSEPETHPDSKGINGWLIAFILKLYITMFFTIHFFYWRLDFGGMFAVINLLALAAFTATILAFHTRRRIFRWLYSLGTLCLSIAIVLAHSMDPYVLLPLAIGVVVETVIIYFLFHAKYVVHTFH